MIFGLFRKKPDAPIDPGIVDEVLRPFEPEDLSREPLVKKILVPRSLANSGDGQDLIDAVIEFVNDLFEAGYQPYELPIDALAVYYIDFFDAEMKNGGIQQYIFNSHWGSTEVGYLRFGLEHLKLQEQAKTLAAAENILEKTTFDIERQSEELVDTRSKIFALLEPLNDPYLDLPEDAYIETLIKHIRTSERLTVLDDDDYQDALEDYAENVPDKERREAAMDAVAREHEPWREVLDELCGRAGFTNWELNDLDVLADGRAALHLTTDNQHCTFSIERGVAELAEGNTRSVLASKVVGEQSDFALAWEALTGDLDGMTER